METKPGVYTTEFWIMLLTFIVNMLNELGWWNFISNWHSGILMTIAVAAYQVARGQAKSGVGADPNLAANYRIAPGASDGLRR